jgi:hypothetical protein
MILLSLIFSFMAHSHVDFSYGGAFRSYPGVGVEAYGETGYNKKMWDSGGVFYGFVRPSLRLQTSGVINTVDTRFEFNPISFLSFTTGYQYVRSDFEGFNFYDCDEVRCTGDLSKRYFEIKGALAYKRVSTVFIFEKSMNIYSDATGEGKPVAEFRYAALANSGRDDSYRSRLILTYKISSTENVGLLSEYMRFEKSQQRYNMDLVIYSKKREKNNYTYGLGQFGSTHQDRGIIGVFIMSHSVLDSLKLF